MEKISKSIACDHHRSNVTHICLLNDCGYRFLCNACIEIHNKSHLSSLISLSDENLKDPFTLYEVIEGKKKQNSDNYMKFVQKELEKYKTQFSSTIDLIFNSYQTSYKAQQQKLRSQEMKNFKELFLNNFEIVELSQEELTQILSDIQIITEKSDSSLKSKVLTAESFKGVTALISRVETHLADVLEIQKSVLELEKKEVILKMKCQEHKTLAKCLCLEEGCLNRVVCSLCKHDKNHNNLEIDRLYNESFLPDLVSEINNQTTANKYIDYQLEKAFEEVRDTFNYQMEVLKFSFFRNISAEKIIDLGKFKENYNGLKMQYPFIECLDSFVSAYNSILESTSKNVINFEVNEKYYGIFLSNLFNYLNDFLKSFTLNYVERSEECKEIEIQECDIFKRIETTELMKLKDSKNLILSNIDFIESREYIVFCSEKTLEIFDGISNERLAAFSTEFEISVVKNLKSLNIIAICGQTKRGLRLFKFLEDTLVPLLTIPLDNLANWVMKMEFIPITNRIVLSGKGFLKVVGIDENKVLISLDIADFICDIIFFSDILILGYYNSAQVKLFNPSNLEEISSVKVAHKWLKKVVYQASGSLILTLCESEKIPKIWKYEKELKSLFIVKSFPALSGNLYSCDFQKDYIFTFEGNKITVYSSRDFRFIKQHTTDFDIKELRVYKTKRAFILIMEDGRILKLSF